MSAPDWYFMLQKIRWAFQFVFPSRLVRTTWPVTVWPSRVAEWRLPPSAHSTLAIQQITSCPRTGGMSHLGGFLCWMIVDMNHVRAGQIVPQYSCENFDCAVSWCALNCINMVDISIYPHDYWLISQLFMVNSSMIPRNASMNSMFPQLFVVHYTASGHALLHPDDSWLSSW